jgi:hypothetical protein
LINGFDPSGNKKFGVSYTAKPPQLGLMSQQQYLGAYFSNRDWLTRAFYNTQLSVAAVNSAASPLGVSEGALGVSIPLVDRTDWRASDGARTQFTNAMVAFAKTTGQDAWPFMELIKAGDTYKTAVSYLKKWAGPQPPAPNDVRDNLRGISEDASVDASTKTLAQGYFTQSWSLVTQWADKAGNISDPDVLTFNALVKNSNETGLKYASAGDTARYKAASTEAQKLSNKSWNQEKLDFGAAAGIEDAGTGSFTSRAYGGEASYAHPLTTGSQFLVYGKYGNGIYSSIGSMTKPAVLMGTWSAAGRLRGGSSVDGWFGEFQYQEGTPAGASKVFGRVAQLGWDHKFGNQWAEIGIGKNVSGGKFLFGLNLGFDLSPKQVLDSTGAAVTTSSGSK